MYLLITTVLNTSLNLLFITCTAPFYKHTTKHMLTMCSTSHVITHLPIIPREHGTGVKSGSPAVWQSERQKSGRTVRQNCAAVRQSGNPAIWQSHDFYNLAVK